jgi:hypothetical protein
MADIKLHCIPTHVNDSVEQGAGGKIENGKQKIEIAGAVWRLISDFYFLLS